MKNNISNASILHVYYYIHKKLNNIAFNFYFLYCEYSCFNNVCVEYDSEIAGMAGMLLYFLYLSQCSSLPTQAMIKLGLSRLTPASGGLPAPN